jgi:c(7)-type cytochrome triheme protein
MHGSVVRRPRVALAAVLAAALAAVAGAAIVIAADPAPELRLPPDLVYQKAQDSPGPVTFSHVNHVALADNKCTGCHPGPFRMLTPARRMTHEDMNAGRLCGSCHDGKTAVGVQEDCEHCHKPPAAAKPAESARPAAGDKPKGGRS